jgi:hypothetical protein
LGPIGRQGGDFSSVFGFVARGEKDGSTMGVFTEGFEATNDPFRDRKS